MFPHFYPITMPLICLLHQRKALKQSKYPHLTEYFMGVGSVLTGLICLSARPSLVLMYACTHAWGGVSYLNSKHSRKTRGHAGNVNIIRLWQDAVCEQTPGISANPRTWPQSHQNAIQHSHVPIIIIISHFRILRSAPQQILCLGFLCMPDAFMNNIYSQ